MNLSVGMRRISLVNHHRFLRRTTIAFFGRPKILVRGKFNRAPFAWSCAFFTVSNTPKAMRHSKHSFSSSPSLALPDALSHCWQRLAAHAYEVKWFPISQRYSQQP